MHWVTGLQTSVTAVKPAFAHEWFQPPSAIVKEPLENTVLDNYPQTRESLWKSIFPAEKFQYHWKKNKNYECRHFQEGKKNNLTLPKSPLLQGGATQFQMSSSQPVIFHGESERM